MEQLGKNDVAVNLGGIHQLERIAADYDYERYPMLQVLTSYLESNAKLAQPMKLEDCNVFEARPDNVPPAPASQSVISALIDQVPRLKASAGTLTINHVDLRNVDFTAWHAGSIQLAGDDLTRAHFAGSHFDAPSLLAYSRFLYADFTGSHLSGVRLHHIGPLQVLRKATIRVTQVRPNELGIP